MVSNKLQCKVAADWRPGSARLALDGRYLVGLTSDCRSLQVYRTADGIIKVRQHNCQYINSDDSHKPYSNSADSHKQQS